MIGFASLYHEHIVENDTSIVRPSGTNKTHQIIYMDVILKDNAVSSIAALSDICAAHVQTMLSEGRCTSTDVATHVDHRLKRSREDDLPLRQDLATTHLPKNKPIRTSTE